MNVKKGIKNIVYSIVGQVIAMALGIVIPRLVIVSYGSETNGLLSSVGQVISYLSLLEAGVGVAAIQALYKPISQNDKESVNGIMSATHSYYRRTGIIYFCFIVALTFIYPFIIKSKLNYWFMAGIVFVTGLPNVINFFFQGKLRIFLNAVGDNYILTNISTITSTLSSILKIVLLLLGVNVIFVQIMYCGISLLQMIAIYFYIKRKYPWIKTDTQPNYKALSQKNSTLVHQIAGLITNSTDVTILSIFCGLEAVSIYAVYNMIFNLIYNLVFSVNGGLQFLFGQTYCSGRERYIKFINVYETYYTALCAALMSIAYIFIKPFIRLYTAGADINYISFWFPILFVSVEMLRAMRSSAGNTISVAGHFKQTSSHAIWEAIINLVISLIAVQSWGLEGVLLGTIAAFVYRYIVDIYYVDKYILKRKSIHSTIVAVTNIVVVTGIALLEHIINLQIRNYIQLILIAIPISLGVLTIFVAINSLVDKKSLKYGLNYLKHLRSRRKAKNVIDKGT